MFRVNCSVWWCPLSVLNVGLTRGPAQNNASENASNRLLYKASPTRVWVILVAHAECCTEQCALHSQVFAPLLCVPIWIHLSCPVLPYSVVLQYMLSLEICI